MSDHFDITLERKFESSGDATVPGVAGVRRIELITGAERRRHWSDDDEARIVVESFAAGAKVSEVARLFATCQLQSRKHPRRSAWPASTQISMTVG